MNAKKLAIVALGLAGVLATAGAQARGRDDVQFSITIASPVWLRPAPVVVAAPVARFDGRFYDHSGYQRPTRWAGDGDAIPDRFERVYDPRRDRDGDGSANRSDRHDDRHDARDGRGRSRW
ncbi:MAG TPA: hypothetical protein VGK95_14710 [Caldimonas sp.]|jgi:hypothetical protein